MQWNIELIVVSNVMHKVSIISVLYPYKCQPQFIAFKTKNPALLCMSAAQYTQTDK